MVGRAHDAAQGDVVVAYTDRDPVGADRISVGVRDNDVTLSGMVGSPEHREVALAAAARAAGVVSVRDELTVRERS